MPHCHGCEVRYAKDGSEEDEQLTYAAATLRMVQVATWSWQRAPTVMKIHAAGSHWQDAVSAWRQCQMRNEDSSGHGSGAEFE
jgi:hypothetical protein